MADVCEIVIDGSLMARHYEPGARIGNGRAVIERCIVAGDIVRQIDEADAAGVRSVLLVLESDGGHADATLEVYRSLLRFQRAGGHVTAWIRGRVASAAPILAAVADRVFMAREGRIVLHGAHAPAGHEVAAARSNDVWAAILAARTPMTREELDVRLSNPEVYTEIHPAGATRMGWSDGELWTIEQARNAARLAAIPGEMKDPRYDSPRSRRLAQLAAGVLAIGAVAIAPACGHQTQSSEAPGVTYLYDPEARIQETALRGWTVRTMPTGIWQGLATNGARLVAVRPTVTSLNATYSDDDGANWSAAYTISAHSYADIAHNGTVYCAISNSASGISATSTTGDSGSWTQRTNMPAGVLWTRIAAVGSAFVAFGYQTGGGAGQFVTRSTDGGVTWAAATTLSAVAVQPGPIAVMGDTVVAMQHTTGTGAKCWQSTDAGLTWTERTVFSGALTFTNSNAPIATDGIAFLAAVQTGANATDPYTVFMSSTGESWAQAGTVPYGGGALVCSGRAWVSFTAAAAPRFATSTDKVAWEVTAPPVGTASSQLAGIWTGTRAVTVGSSSGCTSDPL